MHEPRCSEQLRFVLARWWRRRRPGRKEVTLHLAHLFRRPIQDDFEGGTSPSPAGGGGAAGAADGGYSPAGGGGVRLGGASPGLGPAPAYRPSAVPKGKAAGGGRGRKEGCGRTKHTRSAGRRPPMRERRPCEGFWAAEGRAAPTHACRAPWRPWLRKAFLSGGPPATPAATCGRAGPSLLPEPLRPLLLHRASLLPLLLLCSAGGLRRQGRAVDAGEQAEPAGAGASQRAHAGGGAAAQPAPARHPPACLPTRCAPAARRVPRLYWPCAGRDAADSRQALLMPDPAP